jgi:hypothetical protein
LHLQVVYFGTKNPVQATSNREAQGNCSAQNLLAE